MFTQELQKIQEAMKLLVAAGVSVRCIMILISGRSDDQPLAKVFQRCKRILIAGVLIVTLPDIVEVFKNYLFVNDHFDDHIRNTALFAGSLALIKAVINMAIGVDAVCTVISVSKELLSAMSGPPEEKTVHYQCCKKNLVIGISILLVFSVVNTVLSHYFL